MSTHPRRHIAFFGNLLFMVAVMVGWSVYNVIHSKYIIKMTAIVAEHSTQIVTTEQLDSEKAWDFEIGGKSHSISIALDEAMIRDVDGKETLVKLVPPATWDNLPVRLARSSESGDAFPVGYFVGEERTVTSRQIITADIRLQLDPAMTDKIAAQHHLVLKELPTYAPGWVIMSASSPLTALETMSRLRAVREVASADVLLAVQHSLRAMPNDPLIGNQWHLKQSSGSVVGSDVNIETIWNYPAIAGSRGAGIRIGIVDDGLQTTHPDLVANVDTLNDKDWNGNDADPNPGFGDDHGTACAGNAAARGNNGIGVSGTAPEATLVGLRLIAASVTDAQEAEAMSYLSNLIAIKSNSWGPGDTGAILEGPGPLTLAALQSATTIGRGGKGSIILWAGGNGGNVGDNANYDGYANSIYTIAIGATNSLGRRSDYSEPGSNIVVCAPSNGVLGITTVDRSGTDGYSSNDYTNIFGGTSSAAPTAAGIVALMLEKNPNLGWRDVKEILIRSAARPPASTGWVTNGGGIPFSYDFGSGLIDATAAVNLAATWTNLPAQTSITLSQVNTATVIPESNDSGIVRNFDFSASNIRIEHVTVKINVSHSARGNLDVTLTSPSNMVSKLAEVHNDTGDNYSNWTFSTVRHWSESSTGIWTLKIADRSATGNSNGGMLNSAAVTIFGSANAPINPVPSVQIIQPVDGQVFSPGVAVSVNIAANDVGPDGANGNITQVELFDNGVSVGTDNVAPYSFNITPSLGTHSLVARATDSEAAVGSSVSIGITVRNQAPVITHAALSASGQSYVDVPLSVSSVAAFDPEGSDLSISYQWQSSMNSTLFTNEPSATSSIAPPIAGKLLRCLVTASDGNSSSDTFVTSAVNLLARPMTRAMAGSAYSYESGLVLRSADATLSRPAIIHEFSQGPSNGSAEWIEILTLRSGSLSNWVLRDAVGNSLVFLNRPEWAAIPAGTLIVIYNGASKDPLLPIDDYDPSDYRMVVSSTDLRYFSQTSAAWLSLGNSGNSIFLVNSQSEIIHSLAYGNSTAATLNVGSVGSGKSVYFSGDSDPQADLSANWRVTTSLSARNLRTLLPGVTLAGGRYVQDFNATPGTNGTAYPDGWTAYNGSTADSVMFIGTSTTTTAGNYNYGSRIGLLGSDSGFDPGSLVLAVSNTIGSVGLKLSFDVVKIREQGRSMSFKLQYSTTSPTTGFTDLPGAEYTSSTLAANTVTPFTNVALPSAVENSTTTLYLRWLYGSAGGSGSRDGVALDNVVISSASVMPTLALVVTPTVFAENLGSSAAAATVSIPSALVSPLSVALASSDESEVIVPTSIIIAAGQTISPEFPITAVDDSESDGQQQVSITASADGYSNTARVLTVTDDEPSVEGVTPGGANNLVNLGFVTALRNGSLNRPALFRFGAGSRIPSGLSLDSKTGILNGTLALSNAIGEYTMIIERYNTLGENVSQVYTLSIASSAGVEFSEWIGNYFIGEGSGFNDDFDHDGLPNGIENFLGTRPDLANTGIFQTSVTATSLVFRHPRSNSPAPDINVSYEWSNDLAKWYPSAAVSDDGVSVVFVPSIITDTDAPANDLVEVVAMIQGPPGPHFFVRLKATR